MEEFAINLPASAVADLERPRQSARERVNAVLDIVEELAARKRHLTPESFRVTQQEGTEPPFANAYWNQHAPGIYVDVVSGEPLFSSREKYESGTGWPSFWTAMPDSVDTETDNSYGMVRTEVMCGSCGGHLGHLFPDGPAPTGMRYCINSASLKLDKEG